MPQPHRICHSSGPPVDRTGRVEPDAQAAKAGVGLVCGLALVLAVICGCGESGSRSEAEAPEQERSSRAENERGGSGSNSLASNDGRKPGSPGVDWVDEDGRRYLGKTPYDVWPDDPLALALDKRPIGGPVARQVDPDQPPSGAEATQDPAAAPPEPATAAATGSNDDWKSIAPMPVLEAEVKRIRNFLAERMQAIPRYNGAYNEIAFYGSTLAAVAAVIGRHPEPISWKEDAPLIRDLGTAIQDSAVGLGRKHYEATQTPYENFVSLLNRNRPPGLPQPEEAAFADKADRGGLMKRMEKAFNWMHKNITTEEIFKKESTEIVHEATILAALSKVIADESYFFADEDAYQAHAGEMLKSSLDAAESAKTGDFQTFRTALDRANNKCTQCHTDYR